MKKTKTKTKMQNKNQFLILNTFYFTITMLLAGVFLLPTAVLATDVKSEKLIELTNIERQNTGLENLTANQLLTKAAFEKGQTILEKQNFSHTIDGKKFSTWIKDAEYKYSYVGENLAIDFVTSEGTVDAWMESSEHKKNILNPYYSEIGIAVLTGNFEGSETILTVQMFGAPPREILNPQFLSTENKNLVKLSSTNSQAQNYLTHAGTNSFLKPNNLNLKNNTPRVLSGATPQKIEVNNNFIHLHLIFLKTFFTLLFSISLLTLTIYLYIYSFSHLKLNLKSQAI